MHDIFTLYSHVCCLCNWLALTFKPVYILYSPVWLMLVRDLDLDFVEVEREILTVLDADLCAVVLNVLKETVVNCIALFIGTISLKLTNCVFSR
jgi:hypothetical protein